MKVTVTARFSDGITWEEVLEFRSREYCIYIEDLQQKMLSHHVKGFTVPLRYQVMFEASALNGCRTGEVCTVRVEDFDFGDQVFWILDSKKHKYRSVPLNPTFALHAEEYIRLNHLVTGPFFQKPKQCGRPGKSPFIQPQTVHKAWERMCVALGLPMMTPRIARAYSAWMLLYGYKEHGTFDDVQDFLGHDNPNSTKIYLDMIDDFDSRKERYQRIVQSGEIEENHVLKPNLEAKF